MIGRPTTLHGDSLPATTKNMITLLGKRYDRFVKTDRIYAAKIIINDNFMPIAGNKRWLFTLMPTKGRGKFHSVYGATPECFYDRCIKYHCAALAELKEHEYDASKEKENPRPSLVSPHMYDDG